MAKSAPNQLESLNINLIPTDEGNGNLAIVVHWLLTVGRYLIIATEVIALIIFGLSVKLTLDKNNLKESIDTQKQTIDQLSTNEDLFRTYQAKLTKIALLQENHSNTASFYSEFITLLPFDVVLDEIKLDGGRVVISGNLPDPGSLQSLISSLNNSGKFSDFDITNLTVPTAQQPYYVFTATTTLKPGLVHSGYLTPTPVAPKPGGAK
jgi:Tfp pilus assembly protein PilN